MVGFAGSFQRKRSRMSGKSVLSLVLCMTMVLGMLSGIRLTAKADDEKVAVLNDDGEEVGRYATLSEAYMDMFFTMDGGQVTGFRNPQLGDTIMLLDDVTIDEDLWIGPSVTLALNGKTFTINNAVTCIDGYDSYDSYISFKDIDKEGYTKGGTVVNNADVDATIWIDSDSIEAYMNGGCVSRIAHWDGTMTIAGGTVGSDDSWDEMGALYIDQGTVNVSGGTIYGIYNTAGELTVTGGSVTYIQQEGGAIKLSGGKIGRVGAWNNDSGENGLSLEIAGNATEIAKLSVGYYGGESAGYAEVTISGAPQIQSLGFDFDEGEGVWGSLTITGGYFGEDPKAVLATYDAANTITAVINEVEEYNSQSNWIEDHETYGWRIVGGDYGDDGNENVSYSVAFNTNGGTQIADQNVEANGVAVKPEDPTREHYSFVNWYADEAFTTPFDFVAPITADTTVYAKWNYEMEVESQDNTEASTEAAEEVKKLVEQIVAGNEVEGMDAALVGKINDAIADGKDIKVQVTSPKVAEADVQADADKIREKVRETVGNDAVVAAFYDIDVNVLIDGALAGNVTKLGHKIPLRLAVPDDLPAVPAGFTRVFSVFKLHGGVASKLSANMNGIWCEFESDEFSTYALVYEDVKDGDDDDDDDDDAQTVTTTSTTAATTQNVVKSPKTGDQAPYSLWIAISCLGMAGLVSRRACRRE